MSESISVQQSYYTIVSNDVLKDPSLSARAKGLYAYLLSNREGFVIYKKEVVKHFKEGRDAIYKAFDELVDAGWIAVEYKRDKGKFGGSDYTVIRDKLRGAPQPEKPDTVSSDTEKPDTDNPSLINNNSNKYQNESLTTKNTVCDFEDYWSFASQMYKKHKFRVGNKQPALKAYRSAIKKTDLNNLKTQLANQIIAKRALLNSKEFTPSPRALSTWLNQQGWEDEVDQSMGIENASHSANKGVSSHILEDKFGNEAWGVNADGSF